MRAQAGKTNALLGLIRDNTPMTLRQQLHLTVLLSFPAIIAQLCYTRIGKLDNPSGLASALGRGNVTVTFEMNNN